MKKTIVILSALIALVACNKEKTQPENTQTVFNITITREDDTKAVKAGWENGDVVYVFFSTVAAPNYVKYTYDGTDWSNTKVGTFDITEAGTMTAIYLPYGNSETVSASGTSFVFGNTYTSYYLKDEKAAYTVDGDVVSGSLNMTAPDGFVQFAMPITNGSIQFFRETAGAYTLSESHLTPCAIASVAADGTISNMTGSDYAAGKPITGYFYGEGNARTINFSGILSSAGSATDYSFDFVNNMGTVATYDDVTYYLADNKTIAAKAAIKFPLISSSSWKVYQPGTVTVDGVQWAKWNVGATTVEGYGDYFAWGYIHPQYQYTTLYYQGSDVAYQKLGSDHDWRMPTKDELTILKNKISDATWTTENGVYGHRIPSDSGTDYLFLPAAGLWDDVFKKAGSDGYYWSSTLYDTINVWELHIGSDFAKIGVNSPRSGMSVRPVYDPSI